jgi:hypothetical protein
MGSHIVNGQFKSDKYAWCEPGFLALKLTDRAAQPLIWEYAQTHRAIDSELSDDLETALRSAGYQRDRHFLDPVHDAARRFSVRCEVTYYRAADGDVEVRSPATQCAQLSMSTSWFPSEGTPKDAFTVLNQEIEAAFERFRARLPPAR